MDIVKIKKKLKNLQKKQDIINKEIENLKQIIYQSKINNFKNHNYCSIILDIFSNEYKKILKSKNKTIYSNYYCKIHKCNHNDCPIKNNNRKYVTL